MKPRILFTILTLYMFSARVTAQYVAIPDSNFGNWLYNNGYAGCMIGASPNYQLDTTCNAVLTAYSIECSSQNIHDLTGIQYFKGLRLLSCKSNPLGSLSLLPDSIIDLDCSLDSLYSISAFPLSLVTLHCTGNSLDSLPAIPDSVTNIDCSSNRLTALPTLPNGLGNLSAGGNFLTSLPTLPSALYYLDFSNNQMTAVPYPLPAGLSTLYTSGNRIHVLPTLPSGLDALGCEDDSLSVLPALPSTLQFLWCYGNQLTSLPTLPHLIFLNCNNNQLTSLPALPNTLTYFDCSVNQLISLPSLPDSLSTFNCYANPNLTCLPELKKIGILNFSATAVTCLPSYGSVDSSIPALSSLPLCGINNPNGCNVSYNLSGQLYHDVNTNCVFDSNDVRIGNVKVMLYDTTGALLQQYFSGGDGYYSFNVNNVYGTYTTQVDTFQTPFTVNCPIYGSYTSVVSSTDSFFTGEDFALNCKQGFDVGVFDIMNDMNIVARPASLVTVYITAGDLANQYNSHCSAGVGGQVQAVFSGPATYQGIASGALAPASVSGDTITWTIPDFSAVSNNSAFNILLQIDSSAQAGTPVCFDVNVTPTTGDNNPANNTLQYCFNVVNALDPNEKEVYPAGNIDTNQQWLTYTIRFQNTGNAPAQNIYILDTLSNNLDASTIQLLNASHKNVTQVLSGNIVRFNFPNINLPDSATNEAASHGYIRYKIKLKHGLAYGATVNNTANIYFDLNPAVATNTTSNRLSNLAGITQMNTATNDLAVTVYPNPTENLVNIAVDTKGSYTIRLLDINGAEMMMQTGANSTATLNIGNLANGIYIVEVRSNGLQARKKIVKM